MTPKSNSKGNEILPTASGIQLIRGAISRRAIELMHTKGLLDQKYIELAKLNKALIKQNKQLIRTTNELMAIKAQLEVRNKELQSANKEIQKMLTMKTEFMNEAAHDLRTPLTPILTLTPLIKLKVNDPELLRHIAVIDNNAHILNNIIQSLINVIKSQTGIAEYSFEFIDMKALIDEVLSNYDIMLKEHKLKAIRNIEKGLPKIRADKLKITEVLQNILSNAVKFSKGNGTITINAQKKDRYVNVSVSDTGIGMSKETLKRLFEEFFKADTSRHSFEGVGLGLSICKRIVENHHGKIWAESKGLGKGTTIIFEIPIKQS